VEPVADPRRPLARGRRDGREQLEPRGRERFREAEVGRRPRQPGEQERLGLAGREPGQPGAVAVEQPEAAPGARVAVDRDAGRAQGVDVPVDRAHRDLERRRQGPGREAPAELEQDEHRQEPVGAHGGATIAEER
jgi:hypothetical protein